MGSPGPRRLDANGFMETLNAVKKSAEVVLPCVVFGFFFFNDSVGFFALNSFKRSPRKIPTVHD